MNPTMALGQLANYASAAIGLAESQYPAKGTAPKYPGLVLFWDETPITEFQEQYWIMTVRGQLMVALKGKTENDIALADNMIPALVDAFAVGTQARHLQDPNSGDRVAHCRVERVQPSQEITYAGLVHYGALVWWNIKLRRFAGDA